MVPFTIFQRLSSLGSGGGVKACTIPPVLGQWAEGSSVVQAFVHA
jgi:hypothetical protein